MTIFKGQQFADEIKGPSSEIMSAFVCFLQNNKTVLKKNESELTFKNDTLGIFLTADETSEFASGEKFTMCVRIITSEGIYTSTRTGVVT